MKKIFITLISFFACALMVSAQSTKVKVLIDNDFCGDPDGLFALAQQALCPTTDIVGIVGGHLKDNAGFTTRKDQATESVENANALLNVIGLKGKYKVVTGAESGMISARAKHKEKEC